MFKWLKTQTCTSIDINKDRFVKKGFVAEVATSLQQNKSVM